MLPGDAREKQNDYVMLSDILPTGYHGTELAQVGIGESVVIWGAGPVGLMAAMSARLRGADQVFVVDRQGDRLKLDMAVRGRGSSSAPQDLVKAVADHADIEIPGHGDERDNRLAGLGPLSGAGVSVVGAAAGIVLGALRRRGVTLPAPVPVVLTGAGAMALADVPLKVFGISDPADWEGKDWSADALPHLLYGLVTYTAIRATEALRAVLAGAATGCRTFTGLSLRA